MMDSKIEAFVREHERKHREALELYRRWARHRAIDQAMDQILDEAMRASRNILEALKGKET